MQPNSMDPMTPPPAPPTPPVPPTPPRRMSIVGPVILILLGLAFLVSNLGIFSFNVWELMWRLWPVWLIAIGLDMMIGRRTAWGSWVVLGLVVTVIAGSVVFFGSFGFSTAPGDTIRVDQPVAGATQADVTIRGGVGEFIMTGGAPDDKLAEGTVYQLPGERISSDATGTNGRLVYTLKSEGVHVGPNFGINTHDATWQLQLNEKVPMDLKLSTGVGKSNIDLSRLNLTSLSISTGVGESTFTMPAKGKLFIDINTGVGQTTVQIPRGTAARIRARNGIGSVSVSGGFQHDGDAWVTDNYNSATDRLDIEVKGGIGEVRIREVNP